MAIIDNNKVSKQDTQKRILMATVLSFVFFMAYDFFFIQPQAVQQQELNKKTQIEKNITPDVKQSAPTNISTNDVVANTPQSSDIATNDVISTITTNNNIIEIDSLGRIAQVTLLKTQYIDEEHKHIKLFKKDQLRPLEVRFSNRALNDEAFKNKVIASASTVNTTNGKATLTLTQKLSTSTLVKTLTIYPDGHYDIDVKASNNESFFITTGYRPDVLADMYTDHGALVSLNDGTLDILKDTKLDKTTTFTGVQIAAAFDRYYTSVLYNTSTSFEVSAMPDSEQNPQLFIHVKGGIALSGYLGPKSYKDLEALDPKLTSVIEYGWFTFIAKPMFQVLQFLHSYIGNWGWTIVAITILIKLLLYPLAYKGMVSMNRLKELSPKVKQIQEKYKDDKQKASMHMMELYKKEGANPMGGCLPMILQIPVFFSIYRVLLNAIELKGSAWILWIDDLSLMDPYYVLPILMGITMFIQQKITPNQMQDETQKKMFMALPVIFTFFFLWFPAGLTLYWFTNNLFTVAQQYYVNTLFAKAKLARHKEHESKSHTKAHNKK